MPFIITTTHYDDSPMPSSSARHAVATLDEARDFAGAAVSDAHEATGQSWNRIWEGWAYEATDLLDEPGGTIGPLPDGTVITVESVEWHEIGDALEAAGIMADTCDHPIDAYNAQQS